MDKIEFAWDRGGRIYYADGVRRTMDRDMYRRVDPALITHSQVLRDISRLALPSPMTYSPFPGKLYNISVLEYHWIWNSAADRWDLEKFVFQEYKNGKLLTHTMDYLPPGEGFIAEYAQTARPGTPVISTLKVKKPWRKLVADFFSSMRDTLKDFFTPSSKGKK